MSIADIRVRVRSGFVFEPIFAVLFVVEFVRGAFLVSYLPAYAADRLHITAAAVGIAVSIHYLADNLVKCFVGYLLDRFSSKAIVCGGLAFCLLSLLLMEHAHTAWLLYTAAGMLGLGGSPVWLVALTRIESSRRAEQMGALYMYWLAGLGLGPVVINFVMDSGYAAAFCVMFALLAAGSLYSVTISSHRRPPAFTMTLKEQGKELIGRLKGMGLLVPGMILQTAAGGLLVPVLGTFASERIGLTHSQLSFVMIIGGLGAVLFLVPLGRLSDRYGGRRFMAGGFGMFAAAVFGLTYAKGFLEAAVLAVILGVSYAALLPAWNALLASHVPEDAKGTGWGLVTTIEGAGVMVGPVVGGLLAVRYEAALPFKVCALLFASISAVYLFSRPASARSATEA